MRPAILHPAARPCRPIRAFAQVALALLVLTFVAALSPARAGESAPGVLDAAMEAVLVVHSADDGNRFLGSAFLWGAQANVALTNAHVVGDAAQVRLIDRQGRVVVVPVIARDPARDIAVLGLNGAMPDRPGLVVGPAPDLGARVWAMGAPLGLAFTLTEGMVSAAPRQVEPAVPLRLVQHNAAVNPGSSGGPLVDAQGRLVGMNARIADGSRMFVGIAYAITAADLSRLVPRMIAEDMPAFPNLDLRARPVDLQLAKALGVLPKGLLLDAVGQSGLAARGGLKVGDILLSVDGILINGAGDLAFAIEAGLDRGAVDLTILREGRALVVSLGLLPPLPAPAALTRSAPGEDAARVASYRLQSLGLEIDARGRLTALRQNSPALWSGLAVGDRILAINGTRMDAQTLGGFEMTAPAVLLVQAPGGQTRHVFLDPWTTAHGLRPIGGANVLDPAVVVF